jgi:IS30 family transposase
LPKGKPWTVQDERELRKLRENGKTVSQIATRMGLSEDAVKQKLRRLGLKVVTLQKSSGTTTSELIMPEELPSIEEALKQLVAAMNALKTPWFSKTEIMRLRALIQTCSLYQHRIAEYVDFRGIEKELFEMKERLETLNKQSRADVPEASTGKGAELSGQT